MATATTEQKHQQLHKLSNKSKKDLFEMLKLADEILNDPAYCDQYDGEQALSDHLEATDFSHMGRIVKLSQMLRAYRKNPDRSVWEQYRYDIKAMILLSAPAKDTEQKERINWKAKAKELQVKVDMQADEIKKLEDKLEAALVKQGRTSRLAEIVG